MLSPRRKEIARAVGVAFAQSIMIAVVAGVAAFLITEHWASLQPGRIAGFYAWIDRQHARLVDTAPTWMLIDLGRFVRWTVPLLFFVYAILTVVQHIQARDKMQTSMRNLFAGECLFWGVVWISFSLRTSLIWTLGEFAAYTALIATAVIMIYRLVKRYGFNRTGDGETIAH